MSGRWRSWVAGAVASAAVWAAAAPASGEPVRSAEWPLDARHFQAEKVWTLSRGEGVTVAVVDSGVSASHPDLIGQVLPGTSLLGDGGDGRSDTSGDSHGTAVSGIVVGTGGADGQGMVGLAPGAKVLPVKVTAGERVSPPTVAQGIVWAADHGAKVINVSLGTPTPDPLLKQAVVYAMRKDAVVVASAGNEGGKGNPVEYPAAFPGVVSVSGVNEDGSFWTPSESGAGIALAAPASDIYSANDIGQYVHAEGTSYASAYVAATAALIRSRQPELTQGQVVRRLVTGTKDHRAVPDPRFGYGLLDPLAALTTETTDTGTGNPLEAPVTASAPADTFPWPAALGWATGALVALGAAGAVVLRRRQAVITPHRQDSAPRKARKNSTAAPAGSSPKKQKKKGNNPHRGG